ncbi:MAG: hypothetical protein ACI9JN_001353 [Bacteroidia bacterium]|jgi:hypothetical protein
MIRGVVLFLVTTLCSGITFGQGYVVKTVEMDVGGWRPHVVKLPYLNDTINPNTTVVEEINRAILNHFDLEEYEVKPEENYNWFIDTFIIELNDNIIYYNFRASFVSNRAYDHDWEVYFNLKTGEKYNGQFVDFHTLFKPDQYLPFIELYWKPKTVEALRQAYACEVNGYIDEQHSVSRYFIKDDSINLISMSYRDFPTMYWECAPYVNFKLGVKDIRTSLTPAGNVFIDDMLQVGDSKLKVFEGNQRFIESAVDAMYVFGKVDSLYAMSMYLEINREKHEVSGWYYYDKYKTNIELSGTIGDGEILLSEKTSNGLGGVITFSSKQDETLGFFSSMYDVEGTYYNPVKDELYQILITDFLVSPF